jgi:hypothetical protein
MSLEYFLLSRKIYQKILNEINQVISTYDELLELTDEHRFDIDDELYNTIVPDKNSNILIKNKNHILRLRDICDKNIEHLCQHDFEQDSIDITSEKSQTIEYCTICGYTK